MRKKNYAVAAVSALVLALTACGGGNTKEETTAVETTAVETTAESSVEDNTEESRQADSEEEKEEETEQKEAAEVSEEDIAEFAEEAESAVMNKDMKALADMITYPVFVASVEDNEGVVDTKEAFLAIGKDALFTDAFVEAVTSVDVTEVEESEAGYVIGDGTPNIIFNVAEDGSLGITGINNK